MSFKEKRRTSFLDTVDDQMIKDSLFNMKENSTVFCAAQTVDKQVSSFFDYRERSKKKKEEKKPSKQQLIQWYL